MFGVKCIRCCTLHTASDDSFAPKKKIVPHFDIESFRTTQIHHTTAHTLYIIGGGVSDVMRTLSVVM